MPDGSKAYVNAENDGSVVVVDAVKQKMKGVIPLGKPGQIKPMAVLLSPDASRLYVSTGRGKQVFTIDTATDKTLGPWRSAGGRGALRSRRMARSSIRRTDRPTTSR